MEMLKPYKKFASEDVVKTAETEVHELFEKYIEEIEKQLTLKEQELMK